MNPKVEVHIDSTLLGTSACIKCFYLTGIGSLSETNQPVGGYKTIPKSVMVYGVAGHRYIDVMFKTGGHIPTARAECLKAFNVPKESDNGKYPKLWLDDPKHLLSVCYNVWEDYIAKDSSFEILQIPTKCWWCDGTGNKKPDMTGSITCEHCFGKGIVDGPATELTFSIKIFEDENIIVYLEGTIDAIGKFVGGVYAIKDTKFTTFWNAAEFLEGFDMSRQLRIYTLACKLQSRLYPDSILGKLGKQKMGAFIDGIFVKPKSNEVEWKKSRVHNYSEDDLGAFEYQLMLFCKKLSLAIHNNYFPKEGILNGHCSGKFSNCAFWNVCNNNDAVGNLLLKRDFQRKIYNPLNFNGE